MQRVGSSGSCVTVFPAQEHFKCSLKGIGFLQMREYCQSQQSLYIDYEQFEVWNACCCSVQNLLSSRLLYKNINNYNLVWV